MSFKETIEWFGGVLLKPLDPESRLIPTSETEKAGDYIAPSPTLEPVSRIEIYAQQYWWRLYSILQDHFPTLTRLFGLEGFNENIATPYLVKNPPKHWNINLLGDDLVDYLVAHYTENDAPLILAAAELDAAYLSAFIAPKLSLPSLETELLYLAPIARLFRWRWNLPVFRKALKEKEADYWVENDFPELEKGDFYFLLFRSPTGDIQVDQIDPQEFTLLKDFENGVSLTALCEKNPHLEKELTEWIPRWISRGLLTPEKASEKERSISTPYI